MADVILGYKAARENTFRLDVRRAPCQCYKSSRQRTDDIKKAPQLYSTFCRLCNLEKKSGISIIPRKTNNKPPAFEPAMYSSCARRLKVDLLRCSCDENSLNVLRQLSSETPKHCDRTLPPRWMQDRFMNEVLSNFIINETAQLPLSTIVIRWKIGRNIPTYDKGELKGLLSVYGNVHTIYRQTPNSATVVFNDIASACRVIQAKHLGEPRNKIHCVWYHKFMSNKAFYTTSKGLTVRSDPYIQMYNTAVVKKLYKKVSICE
ncbi:hypothetical protein SNE40_011969 [Patella caerulea]|uniref:Uncharacterized protein n=1 Tax=Patella caerulea TaxID=87958 RepID=A0AAN8JR87_PATCE